MAYTLDEMLIMIVAMNRRSRGCILVNSSVMYMVFSLLKDPNKEMWYVVVCGGWCILLLLISSMYLCTL